MTEPDEIARAAALLRAGELVAFPTETVYGLGADASNPQAVARIFAAKGRPADHPLIVHLPDAAYLDRWAVEIPEAARKLAAAFWPGPLTLILKRGSTVPDAVTGGQNTVGLRVPNHPLALALLHEFKGGIAAPSANRFGRISPTTAAHVAEEMGNSVAMILDGGACEVGIESTILDLSRGTPEILRPGVVGADEIAAVVGASAKIREAGQRPGTAEAPRVSGSLEAHYAPRTPLQLVAAEDLPRAIRDACAAGQRIAVLASRGAPNFDEKVIWQEIPASAAGFAHALYAELRSLDALGCERILVQQPPESIEWLAVADRLRRAAAGSGGA